MRTRMVAAVFLVLTMCTIATGAKQNGKNPKKNDCPEGYAVCFANPCDVNTCPAKPTIECRADYCGGCNARFYIQEKEFSDSCHACKEDIANCTSNPCDVSSCPKRPKAECWPDYCGGCHAKFYFKGQDVTNRC